MGLEIFIAPIVFFPSPAVGAAPASADKDFLTGEGVNAALACAGFVIPGVLGAFKPDIAFWGVEGRADGVLTVGVLRAVDAAAGHKGGELSDSYPVNLLGEDVVDPLLGVRNNCYESFTEAASRLPQEDSSFHEGIQHPGVRVCPQVLSIVVTCPRFGCEVKHGCSHFWRCEHFIV